MPSKNTGLLLTHISLRDGKIVISAAGKEARFSPTDEEAMARHIVPGLKMPTMCASSVDWPEDEGFPEGFNARPILTRVFERARQLTAISIASRYVKLDKAVKHIEAVLDKHSFPVTLQFDKSGKKGEDVCLTFDEDDDLQYFLSGLAYGNRLASFEKATQTKPAPKKAVKKR